MNSYKVEYQTANGNGGYVVVSALLGRTAKIKARAQIMLDSSDHIQSLVVTKV